MSEGVVAGREGEGGGVVDWSTLPVMDRRHLRPYAVLDQDLYQCFVIREKDVLFPPTHTSTYHVWNRCSVPEAMSRICVIITDHLCVPVSVQ